jgi:hypothetical protein
LPEIVSDQLVAGCLRISPRARAVSRGSTYLNGKATRLEIKKRREANPDAQNRKRRGADRARTLRLLLGGVVAILIWRYIATIAVTAILVFIYILLAS